MKLEYSTNNSGGSWWLTDYDWMKMEQHGWNVEWRKERWLGALAIRASKKVATREDANDAILEFERLTSQNVDDKGCNCCGNPHRFTLYDDNDEYIDSFNSYPYFF